MTISTVNLIWTIVINNNHNTFHIMNDLLKYNIAQNFKLKVSLTLIITTTAFQQRYLNKVINM